GPGTNVVAASDDPALLDAIDFDPGDAVCALVDLPDMEAGLELANAFAPEYLELVGEAAEALAPRVRSVGCHGVRRLRRRVQPLPADRWGGTVRVGAGRAALPPAHERGADRRRGW